MWARLRRLWPCSTRPRGTRTLDLPEALRATLGSLTHRFARQGVDHALIGGVALVLHGLYRATEDLDLLVAREAADDADAIMTAIGFERLNRNDVFGNYLLGPLRVDLLFTKGARSRRMLERAQLVELRTGPTKLVRPDDLVGLKLQALTNNPDRAQDRADIEMLVVRFLEDMDQELLRDYFRLFGKETELDALLEAVRRRSERDPRSGV